MYQISYTFFNSVKCAFVFSFTDFSLSTNYMQGLSDIKKRKKILAFKGKLGICLN